VLALRRFFLAFALPFFFYCGFSLNVVAAQQQGTFVPVGSLSTARTSHTATLLSNGMVLVTGGVAINNPILASAELYNPATGTFTATGSMNSARYGQTATLLNNGMVLVAGGRDGNNNPLASAELYDPLTGSFSLTGSMSTPRSGHTATLLNNGMVLMAGDDGVITSAASAELYSPQTGTFTTTGSLNASRAFHTATLLQNGMVLVAGGETFLGMDNLALASAELYNPATGTFAQTGSMSSTRFYATATLLDNGTVLISGGIDWHVLGGPQTTLASAELYDPTTATFTPTGSLNTARDSQTATLLKNGMVLIVGGLTPTDIPGPESTASSEVYNPATGTFTVSGNMHTPREDHTATQLNNETVLVTGGTLLAESLAHGPEPFTLASAELYEQIGLSPPSLSFSTQVLGTTSGTKSIVLTNNNSNTLSITAITKGGTNASDFAETDNCVGTLSAGASCSIHVTFTPSVAGAETGNLAIANDLSANPVPIPLTGIGAVLARIADLSVTRLNYTNVLGTTSTQSVTVNNSGNTALTIAAIAITGTNATDFSEVDTCGGSVAAGGICSINVTFVPSATGARTATLTITDDATSPSSPQTVALSGAGQDFSMTSAAPPATITAGQTATFSVSVSPSGGFNQTVSFACAGAPSLSTCTVSPGSMTLNGTDAATLLVVVATTAHAGVFPESPRIAPPEGLNFRLELFFLALLALALLSGRTRRRIPQDYAAAVALPLIAWLCIGITLVACGGGSQKQNSGTPAGTYSLTVSGTFSSGPTTVTHNTKLTLVVQ
jgi:hypothetical protein